MEIQRSTGAAPGREGRSRAESRSSMQWYHLEPLPARNPSSCVPCAPAGRKEKQSNVFILFVSSECPNANYVRPALVAKGTVIPQKNKKNTAEQQVERTTHKRLTRS